MELLVNNTSTNGVGSLWEQISSQNLSAQNQNTSSAQGDSVSISNFPQRAVVLKDEEVNAVMQSTVDSIINDPYAAMHAHSGLDASRVAALLA